MTTLFVDSENFFGFSKVRIFCTNQPVTDKIYTSFQKNGADVFRGDAVLERLSFVVDIL